MDFLSASALFIPRLIEYCTLLLFICNTILYQRILFRRKVFHANLHFLLQIGPGTYFLYFLPLLARSFLQTIDSINEQWNKNLLFIRDAGMFGSAYNLLTLTIERLVASIFVDRYENLCSNFPILSFFLSLVQWAITTSIMYLAYQSIISNQVLMVSILISVIVSTITFASLPKISSMAHKRSLSNKGLNRYQAVENVRSAKVLNRFVIFIVVSTPGAVALYFLWYHVIAPSRLLEYEASKAALHTYIALMGTFGEAIILHFHPVLKADVRRILRLRKKSSSENSEVVIKSVRGERLNIAANEHSNVYFGLYQKNW